MTEERLLSRPRRLLFGEPDGDADRVAAILADSPAFELSAREPHFRMSFLGTELLAVERGFVVVRRTPEGLARSASWSRRLHLPRRTPTRCRDGQFT
jgi:hypothetical protein